MDGLRQILTLTKLGLASLPQRMSFSFMMIISIAGVAATLISALALATGLRGAVAGTGRPDRAIVLRSGEQYEVNSKLSRDDVKTILSAPGIYRSNDTAFASSAVLMSVRAKKRDSRLSAGLMLRGVTPEARLVHSNIKLVEGRAFVPGLRELVVGRSAQRQLEGLAVEQKLWLRDGEWTIVGVFESGDAHESALWGDAETLLQGFKQVNFSTVTVKLESTSSFDTFKSALTSNPQLSVDVVRESEYYERQSREYSKLLFLVANTVAIIMALGATFAALNAMYVAVRARAVEIGTLRAMGFRPYSVAAATLAESLFLALAGAIMGAFIAWVLFDGALTSADGRDAQVVFQLQIAPPLIALGVVCALSIGLLGGIFPAMRAARAHVAAVLKGL